MEIIKEYRDTIGICISVVFALLPFSFSSLNSPLLYINLLAWLCVTVLISKNKKTRKAIKFATKAFGFEQKSENLNDAINEFTKESQRYIKASFAFGTGYTNSNLSENLSSLAEIAYKEFPSQAVEIKLFEENSKLGSNSLVIGVPLKDFSKNDPSMVSEQIRIGETTFGTINIEPKNGVKFSKNDQKILKVLSAQGAMSFIQSKFAEELLRLNKLGEQNAQAKTGFLANLSHELRGPLGIILNGVELASDGLCGELPPKMCQMLEMIKGSGDHLLDLINDVLDYAKVEAGKTKATPVVLPVKELLVDITNVVRTQAFAKKHSLTLGKVSKDFAILVDKRHIRQMLINLLTNAIKYTPKQGQIDVLVERISEDKIKISVKDSGIGIAKEDHAKVFAAFERVENQYAMSQSGTGLGMPLTKKLAEVNNAELGFKSELDKGSTFYLILPAVEIAQVASADDKNDLNDVVLGRGERVLLVDSNKDTREIMNIYLTSQGFEVRIAEGGADFLAYIRKNPVDLAVIENDLPDLTGEDIISAMRSMPQTMKIPTILLSSKAFVFDIEHFIKMGVDRCLSKPVSLSELSITARKLIDEHQTLAPEPMQPIS